MATEPRSGRRKAFGSARLRLPGDKSPARFNLPVLFAAQNISERARTRFAGHFSGGFAAWRVEVRASVRRACGRRTGLRCCLGMRRGGATSRCRRESFSPDPVSSFGGGESRARGEFWPYASASPCRAVVLVRNCVLFAGSQCRSVRFAKAMWDPCGDARVCEVGQGRSEAVGRMRRATGRENEEAMDGLCEGARPPCRALASLYPGFSDGACAELVESVCKGGLQRYNKAV